MRLARFAVVVASALSLHCAVPAAPVPVKDLFRDYDYSSMSLSPDGRSLAKIFLHEWGPENWTFGLAVLDVETRQPKMVQLDRFSSITSADWVGNQRLISKVLGLKDRYDPTLSWGLFAFNVDGSASRQILFSNREVALDSLELVTPRTSELGQVLLAQAKRTDKLRLAPNLVISSKAPPAGVYKVNVETGESSLAVRDPGWTVGWFADPRGLVRVAAGYDRAAFKPSGTWVNPRVMPGARLFWFDNKGEPRAITAVQMAEEDRFEAFGFDGSGTKFLFAGRQGRDRAAVYAYLPASGTVEGPLIESENVDIAKAVLSPHDRTVAGVWVDDGISRIEWLDPKLKALQVGIDATLPMYTNEMVNWSSDYRRILILSTSTQEPGRYYLLDQEKKSLAEVYRRVPELSDRALGSTQTIELTARDGARLCGYLTRPPGATGRQSLPTVLYVHGGPWRVRDLAEFDPIVQFFATRGYAVLQVNYRGSEGYGRRFEELALKQFGRAMQDDLDDAMDWAVARGYADPKKLVIAGASYGGYATLVGVTRHPERYCAGVALFPVSDLKRQIEDYNKSQDYQYANEWWKKWVGDPTTDRTQLEDTSPIKQLERLQAPLFLVYGEDDDRIGYEQSAALVRRLVALKKKFIRFAPRNEGHGLSHEKNRYKIFEALEKFLQKYAPAN